MGALPNMFSMEPKDVDEYVDRCQQLIESSPQMDEENTKVKLVQPFLELLGWDLYSTEVSLEYTIPMASGSTHVDYALLIGDSPVVFVEAKPVRSGLTDSNVEQLQSYMRQELDVDWGILTNGKSFEVLTKNQQNGGEEVSVVQFDLDDLADNPGVLELLSKESIRSPFIQRGMTRCLVPWLTRMRPSLLASGLFYRQEGHEPRLHRYHHGCTVRKRQSHLVRPTNGGASPLTLRGRVRSH